MICPSSEEEQRIYSDTRQQKGKHINKELWWAGHGVKVETKKLDTGDYTTDGSFVLIDTKKDVQELAGNVGRDHDRFVRELDRAVASGHRLIILVEEHPEYEDREKLKSWKSRVCTRCRKCNPLTDQCKAKRRKPMNGPQLAKILDALEERHGARFMFCSRNDSAQIICELLGVRYQQ